MKKCMIICIGGSGSGKSTFENYLYSKGFHKIISTTTRPIRPEDGEVDGVSYHYVSIEEFKELDLLENVCFGSNYYGIQAKEIETDNAFLTAVVEPEGLKQICEKIPDFNKIIIHFDIPVEQRIANMKKRGDTDEMIEKRLKIDDIDQRFKTCGIKPHKVVTKLTNNLSLDLYEFIKVAYKNFS